MGGQDPGKGLDSWTPDSMLLARVSVPGQGRDWQRLSPATLVSEVMKVRPSAVLQPSLSVISSLSAEPGYTEGREWAEPAIPALRPPCLAGAWQEFYEQKHTQTHTYTHAQALTLLA